jgi:acetoin utilization deacetylase AcuC-like enzyme
VSLAIPFVWNEATRRHDPRGEVWVGVRTPGTEVPARADRIREALEAEGAPIHQASPAAAEELLAVHDPELLSYLARAWEAWQRSRLPTDPGQDRVVPYLFPHPALLGELPLRDPAAPAARAGRYAYDTMTLVGPGTWEAARGAAGTALAAADLVAGGEPAAYACCRPPGHHATRGAFGGSCYLNNTAAAAARLRDSGRGPVAVIDIDAHHGNGTQSIFYADPDVLTGSVHVDPGAGWFPHYLGFAGETGAGDGEGANRNLPLAPGSGDGAWIETVGELAGWASAEGARSLVVALGVDAAAGDPESPLEVSAGGYREAGRILGALGLPTVVVQEGGYELETLGALVIETLRGVEHGRG